MPLQDDMKIYSVDDHLIEHPRVWLDRLPAKYQDDAPRIIETPEGNEVWLYEGKQYPNIGLNAVAGKDPHDFGLEPVRYDHMIPGCYDPNERIKDMDVDGVEAAMCYPSFPGFAGGTFFRAQDKALATECVKAWNDFNLEEWYGHSPGRFIPLAMVPFWDPAAAAKEITRVAEKGARCITFPEHPIPLGLPGWYDDQWDVVFSAAEDADIPLSLHFGSSGFMPSFEMNDVTKIAEGQMPRSPFAVAIALFATNLMWSTTDLAFSPVFYKHPRLKIVLAEGGIGWIPYIKERIDYTWERHRWYQDINKEQRPSELFHKHFWGCFIDDQYGLQARDVIGVDRILFEVDYPHSDSNWPNTRKVASEGFLDVPDDDVRKIVETNFRELFKV